MTCTQISVNMHIYMYNKKILGGGKRFGLFDENLRGQHARTTRQWKSCWEGAEIRANKLVFMVR